MRLSDIDFYSSPWLSASDLSGRPARVTVQEWRLENIRQRDGSQVRKIALSFYSKRKRMILNITQAKAAEAAWGEALEGWIGKACILQPGRADNGKDTIILVPLPAQSAPDAPTEHQAPADSAPGAEQPPASAGQAAGSGERMADAEAAELWRKKGEPYPGYSG